MDKSFAKNNFNALKISSKGVNFCFYRNFVNFLSLSSGCHLYFRLLTWGVAHRLLQLSGFQPENLYTSFHWPERPKLQQLRATP